MANGSIGYLRYDDRNAEILAPIIAPMRGRPLHAGATTDTTPKSTHTGSSPPLARVRSAHARVHFPLTEMPVWISYRYQNSGKPIRLAGVNLEVDRSGAERP